jgi:hypothetical protein
MRPAASERLITRPAPLTVEVELIRHLPTDPVRFLGHTDLLVVERASARINAVVRPHRSRRGDQPGTLVRYSSYADPNCRRSLGSSYQCTNDKRIDGQLL